MNDTKMSVDVSEIDDKRRRLLDNIVADITELVKQCIADGHTDAQSILLKFYEIKPSLQQNHVFQDLFEPICGIELCQHAVAKRDA